MYKLIFLLLCYNFLSLNLAEYNAPKSVEYPFGDEIFNSDIREDRVTEGGGDKIKVEIIKDIYTFCPNGTDDFEMKLYDDIPYNENKCSKCDIRPTLDKTGALVECYNCTEASQLLTLSPEETSPEHLLFLTTYLEIANYTATEAAAE